MLLLQFILLFQVTFFLLHFLLLLIQIFVSDIHTLTGAAGTKKTPKIKEVRAFVVQEDEGGADYHRQPQDHWIVQEISNPMSGYPKYKKNRTTYVNQLWEEDKISEEIRGREN
jgi:hypothetical protein